MTRWFWFLYVAVYFFFQAIILTLLLTLGNSTDMNYLLASWSLDGLFVVVAIPLFWKSR